VAGEKILIVDDEESMVQFLSILLTKEGYDVHVARSGKDALEQADGENFDVVVTDIKMPGEIDGLGVLSGVKKIDPSVPVVIRTAFASQRR
jgi:two-component system response regulator PilR (NtrC family)